MTSEKMEAAEFSDTSNRLHGVTLKKTAICTVTEGKSIPVHAWTGPKDFRKFRLPDFKKIGT